MEKAILSRLESDTAVFAALGNRIYPDRIPASVPAPAATFTVAEGVWLPCQSGGFRQSTLEIRVLSPVKAQTVDIGELIAARLDRWAGTLAGQTVHGVNRLGVPMDDFNEPTEHAGGEFIRILKFSVLH